MSNATLRCAMAPEHGRFAMRHDPASAPRSFSRSSTVDTLRAPRDIQRLKGGQAGPEHSCAANKRRSQQVH